MYKYLVGGIYEGRDLKLKSVKINVPRKAYQGRGDGGGGGGGVNGEGGGKRESIYLSIHCHHQNDFCIKVRTILMFHKCLKRKASRSRFEPRPFFLPA